MSFRVNAMRGDGTGLFRLGPENRLTHRRLTHPTRCAHHPEHPECEIGGVFIEMIASTSRRMVPWQSHAAAASRDRSTSIWPRRSDLIAPDARRLRIRRFTVVRRTPRI